MQKDFIISTFNNLRFEEGPHLYLVDDKPLEKSVSNIVHLYEPYFDKESISKAISIRDETPQQEILDSWEEISKEACDLGHKVHKFGELYAYDRNLKPRNYYEEGIVEFWKDIPEHILLVFAELIMYHLKHLYGGTADIIFYDTIKKGYVIADYKTNKDLFKNYMGQTLLGPFVDMLNTPFNRYQIQLSLYQILLEQCGIKVVDRILIWLTKEGYKMYKTEDLTSKLQAYA
jgi:hypothetical protein